MQAHDVHITNAELREAITINVKFPPLLTWRIRASTYIFRFAAWVAGVGVQIEVPE